MIKLCCKVFPINNFQRQIYLGESSEEKCKTSLKSKLVHNDFSALFQTTAVYDQLQVFKKNFSHFILRSEAQYPPPSPPPSGPTAIALPLYLLIVQLRINSSYTIQTEYNSRS